jgi:hypothetical protein
MTVTEIHDPQESVFPYEPSDLLLFELAAVFEHTNNGFNQALSGWLPSWL